MSSLAIVLIDVVGGIILACIDAKSCSSKTRNERRTSRKTNNKQKDKEKK